MARSHLVALTACFAFVVEQGAAEDAADAAKRALVALHPTLAPLLDMIEVEVETTDDDETERDGAWRA